MLRPVLPHAARKQRSEACSCPCRKTCANGKASCRIIWRSSRLVEAWMTYFSGPLSGLETAGLSDLTLSLS
eukprot:2338362-Rhodomonas_salina.1